MSSNNLIVGNLTATGTINNGSNALTTGAITSTGNVTSTGNITSTQLYSDRLYITNGGTTFTNSSLYLDVPNKNLNIYGYFTTDDVYNQRKIKLRDYVELKYLYATNGLAINTTPDNFTYKLNVNGNANITGYIDISGAINNGANALTTGAITSSGNFSNGANTLTTGAITSTGSITINPSSSLSTLYLDTSYISRQADGNVRYYANGNFSHQFYTNNGLRVSLNSNELTTYVPINTNGNTINSGAITATSLLTNSITSTGTTGPLTIDPNYSTNNYVLIYDKLVVGGVIEASSSITSSTSITAGTLNASGFVNCTAINMNGGNINNVGQILYASDARIKTNNIVITNATETLLKLRPEMYDKYTNFELNGDFRYEAGLMAQEVYQIEPLKHLVYVPPNANPTITQQEENDDYSNWGSTPAGINYTGLIPFLIRGFQEQNETINNLKADIEELRKQISTQQTNAKPL